MNEALRDWVTNVDDTFYIIGSVAGPHPYPMMVRDFQAVIGDETREQILEKEGRLPDVLVAAVGGGSNAMGLFHPVPRRPRRADRRRRGGGRRHRDRQHAAAMTAGQPGVLHGSRSYLLQDEDGQVIEPHSISAGLDYPGHRPRALLAQGRGPDRGRRPSATTRRWRRSRCARAWRASCRRSSRPRAGPGDQAGADAAARTSSWS